MMAMGNFGPDSAQRGSPGLGPAAASEIAALHRLIPTSPSWGTHPG
jgi:hypothetical protein